MCTLEDEENLSDHMVEIDILSEIKHRNIVELYEAFSLDDKLWVSNFVFTCHLTKVIFFFNVESCTTIKLLFINLFTYLNFCLYIVICF